jgi:hypothetical protein
MNCQKAGLRSALVVAFSYITGGSIAAREP